MGPGRIGPSPIGTEGRRVRELAILGRATDLESGALPDEWQDVGLGVLCPVAGEVDPALATAFPETSLVVLPQGWMRQRGAGGVVPPQPWEDADLVLPHVQAVVVSHEDIEPFQKEAARVVPAGAGRRGHPRAPGRDPLRQRRPYGVEPDVAVERGRDRGRRRLRHRVPHRLQPRRQRVGRGRGGGVLRGGLRRGRGRGGHPGSRRRRWTRGWRPIDAVRAGEPARRCSGPRPEATLGRAHAANPWLTGRFRITVGKVTADAVLNDLGHRLGGLGTPCRWRRRVDLGRRDLLRHPGEGREREPPRDGGVGISADWPPGSAFCIFYGPTPASRGKEIRPASPVNVFGRVLGDPKVFKCGASEEIPRSAAGARLRRRTT